MADFSQHKPTFEGPATKAVAITPDDSNDLADVTRAIYTGTGGTLVCVLQDDPATVTFTNLPSGCILPCRIRRVKATGTTAGMGLLGLY